MTPYYQDDLVTLWHGDCVQVMREMPDASVDAVVTDPPYGLEFMGKEWDSFDRKGPKSFDDTYKNAPEGADRDAYGRLGGNPRWSTMGPLAMLPFQSWCTEWATEALRVLKPGGHLLAFGGTRTWHRLAVAIEDAGFEVRDSIAWMYGSGFPKSLDVSKAIDKQRHDREETLEVTAWMRSARDAAGRSNKDIDALFGFVGMAGHWTSSASQPSVPTLEQIPPILKLFGLTLGDVPPRIRELIWTLNGNKGQPGEAWAKREVTGQYETPAAGQQWNANYGLPADLTAKERKDKPATPAAKQWQGWGTALKPAFEPIVVARKPLIGTVAENVMAHGTGALNIDGCRIGTEERINPPGSVNPRIAMNDGWRNDAQPTIAIGRWPANVILDESQAAELDRQSGVTTSGAAGSKGASGFAQGYDGDYTVPYGDTGGASRFFYVPKANSSERPRAGEVAHPTVKPLELMRYLVKLVTPPGGTVLEPFAGSGTTLEACLIEGFQVIGIELTEDYLPLITQRISKPIEQVLL